MSDQLSRAGRAGSVDIGALKTSSSRQDWPVFLWRAHGALQKRITMVDEFIRPSTATEQTGDQPNRRDEEVMQALVTAGALVALSDGQLKVR